MIDMTNFSEFHERYSARFNKRFKRICEPLFNTFCVNSFFYQAGIKGRYFVSICTDVDLMNYYFVEHKMYKSNPFITQTDKLKSGVYFQESVQNPKFQETETNLQDKFGIKYFCMLTRKTSDSCHEFGFGRPPERKEIDSLFVNELPLINKFINYFQSEMEDVIKDMHHNPLDLKLDLNAYDSVKTGIPEIEFEKSKRSIFLQNMGFENFILDVKFTRREVDCLKLYTKGYSARQISETLFLSRRTVENYLNNIKNKLLCDNKYELFEILHLMKECNRYPEIFV